MGSIVGGRLKSKRNGRLQDVEGSFMPKEQLEQRSASILDWLRCVFGALQSSDWKGNAKFKDVVERSLSEFLRESSDSKQMHAMMNSILYFEPSDSTLKNPVTARDLEQRWIDNNETKLKSFLNITDQAMQEVVHVAC